MPHGTGGPGGGPGGPGGLSRQARALLEQARAAPRPDLTRPAAVLRAETSALCAPLSRAAVARWKVDVGTCEIAGTRCMTVAPPGGATRGLTILYLFGGGFMQGSPDDDLPIIAALAAQTGADVIAPYYPLAPEHPYPAAPDACTAVASHLLRDRPNACLVGESAGGNLALVVTHRLRARGETPPRALALLSPAADLAEMGDSFEADRDPFLKAGDADFYRRTYLADRVGPAHPWVSPIRGDFDPSFPPMMITTGTRDLLLSTCVRLARVVTEAGGHADLRVWEGLWHVFEYYPGIPEADASLTQISRFLARHLGRPLDT